MHCNLNKFTMRIGTGGVRGISERTIGRAKTCLWPPFSGFFVYLWH